MIFIRSHFSFIYHSGVESLFSVLYIISTASTKSRMYEQYAPLSSAQIPLSLNLPQKATFSFEIEVKHCCLYIHNIHSMFLGPSVFFVSSFSCCHRTSYGKPGSFGQTREFERFIFFSCLSLTIQLIKCQEFFLSGVTRKSHCSLIGCKSRCLVEFCCMQIRSKYACFCVHAKVEFFFVFKCLWARILLETTGCSDVPL